MDSMYDRVGRLIDLEEWRRLRGSADYRRVALDTVGQADVSTVWLGLAYCFKRGRPLIFETIVFNGLLDGESVRYSTEADAVVGHRAMVARVRAAHEAVS